MMIRARKVLFYKRRAAVFWRWADDWARSNAPWAIKNLHLYQSYAVNEEKKRNALLRAYLNERESRA